MVNTLSDFQNDGILLRLGGYGLEFGTDNVLSSSKGDIVDVPVRKRALGRVVYGFYNNTDVKGPINTKDRSKDSQLNMKTSITNNC
uniref:Uncharacterized protein n=1 Tax=Megaselia scalaris TaxID=36166 RepID=T1GE76_MEGSC